MRIRQYNQTRTSTGSLYSLGFIAAIPLMLGIGAFSVDMMHYNSVQAEVQRACDAGALAGAIELWQYGSDPNAPIAAATTVAGMNDADGKAVSGTSGATVNAVVETQPDPTKGVGGTVRVTITRPYKNLLAGIFGNGGSNMTCTALAGPQGVANMANYAGLFPLAVGLNIKAANDPLKQSLNDKKVGDTVYLEFHNNVAWTGFDTHNAKDVGDYENGYMKPGSGCKGSPPKGIGDPVNLTNGVQDSNITKLSQFCQGSSGQGNCGNGKGKGDDDGNCGDGGKDSNPVLFLPVVDDGGKNGSNGSLGPGDRTVIGFLPVCLDGVYGNGANSYLVGKVANANFRGSYEQTKGTAPTTGVLSNCKIQPAKLLN